MSLRQTHTLIVPFQDACLDAATRGARRRSLARLEDEPAFGSGGFRLIRLEKTA